MKLARKDHKWSILAKKNPSEAGELRSEFRENGGLKYTSSKVYIQQKRFYLAEAQDTSSITKEGGLFRE